MRARPDPYLDAATRNRPSYLQLLETVLGDAASRKREQRIEYRFALGLYLDLRDQTGQPHFEVRCEDVDPGFRGGQSHTA